MDHDQTQQLTQTVAEIAKELRGAVNELTQTTTVLRQHIGEQQSINRRRERWEGLIENRIGEQEVRHAALQASLPAKPVDANELHTDMTRVENRLHAVEDELKGISKQVWKWSGGVAAIVSGGTLIIRWVLG